MYKIKCFKNFYRDLFQVRSGAGHPDARVRPRRAANRRQDRHPGFHEQAAEELAVREEPGQVEEHVRQHKQHRILRRV